MVDPRTYWMVKKNDGGDWVWWNDDTEEWVDRKEATRRVTAIEGWRMHACARSFDVLMIDEPDADAFVKACTKVKLSRFAPKSGDTKKLDELEKSLESLRAAHLSASDERRLEHSALSQAVTNPDAKRVLPGDPGYTRVYDLVWNLREAYHAEQKKNEVLRQCTPDVFDMTRIALQQARDLSEHIRAIVAMSYPEKE